MPYRFTNNASTTLRQTVLPNETTLPVEDSNVFPSFGGGGEFKITLEDSDGNYEICTCTAKQGNNLTVSRAEEGTNGGAHSFPAGTVIELRLTADVMDNFAQLDEATFTGDVTIEGNTVLSGTPLVGSDKIWHAGNDGANSGLNADQVDGLHASQLALKNHDHDPDYATIDHTHEEYYESGDTPEFVAVELGGAQDTTLGRGTAGSGAVQPLLEVEGAPVIVHNDATLASGKVRIVTTAPTDPDGADGDIWLVVA